MSGQSFLNELYRGRLRWDLVDPFPQPSGAQRPATASAIATLDRIMPPGRALRPDLVRILASHGFTRAALDETVGGLGLSPWGVARVVCAAVAACPPAGMLIAAENAFGLAALLPRLPAGPLRERIARGVRQGEIGALADTEPHGASNLDRRTALVPNPSGGYLLHGEKLFVSNAPIADLLIVSATLAGRRCLAVVGARALGVRVEPQEFMGLDGFPIGRVVFDGVRVPAERIVPGRDEPGSRITAEAVAMVRTGKVYFTAAPSLALARQLLGWAARFVAARQIDGWPLAEREEVRDRLATAAADVFAMRAIVDWALLTPHTLDGPDAWFERSATKNAVTSLAWRTGERLLPLLGAEGYETEASKLDRKAPRSFPAERALRDLLGLRIAGGVDFHVDACFAEQFILRDLPPASAPPQSPAPARWRSAAAMSLARQVEAFGELRRDLLVRCDRADQCRRQGLLIDVNRLATELLTAALVIARASHPHSDLLRVYLAGSRRRVAGLWGRIRQLRTSAESLAAQRLVERILEAPCPR